MHYFFIPAFIVYISLLFNANVTAQVCEGVPLQYAQCPCQAPLLEGCGFLTDTTYCFQMEDYLTPFQMIVGCPNNAFNNPHWFRMKGNRQVIFTITPSTCLQVPPNNDEGMQFMIYEASDGDVPHGTNCGACIPTELGLTPVFSQCGCTANPVTVNIMLDTLKDYYVVIDGCAGSVCDIEISPILGGIPYADRFDCAELGKVTGEVYGDLNDNDNRDAGEPGLQNTRVTATNGSNTYWTFTDADGVFELYFPSTEAYNLYPTTDGCWKFIGDTLTVVNDTLPEDSVSVSFALKRVDDYASARVFVTPSMVRCASVITHHYDIQNAGCWEASGQFSIDVDNRYLVISSDPEPDSILDKRYFYSFDTISPNVNEKVRLVMASPDASAVGDTLINDYVLELMSIGDTSTFSLEGSHHAVVRCAIDPNDKLVSPSRRDYAGEDYILPSETLTYTVRFQNTGNDTAFYVRIEDRISDALDLSTLEPISQSHDMRISVNPDRTVEFIFDPIVLPDSGANFAASQGYVTFRIRPTMLLSEFDEIVNNARIFFDQNPPIVTNETRNVLVSTFDYDVDGYPFWNDCNDSLETVNPGVVEIPDNGLDDNCDGVILTDTKNPVIDAFSVSPNPFREQIVIRSDDSYTARYEIFDLSGRVHAVGAISNGQTIVQTSNLQSGMYFMRIAVEETRVLGIYRLIKLE